MKTAARVVSDVRAYWPLYLVALVGSLGMWTGATRIDEPQWAYTWIVTAGVAWAAVGLLLKRRIDRRLAAEGEHRHDAGSPAERG